MTFKRVDLYSQVLKIPARRDSFPRNFSEIGQCGACGFRTPTLSAREQKGLFVIVNLRDFFEENLFIPELKSTTKTEALSEMVECLVEAGRIRDGEVLLNMLHQRESLGSTGIGRGIAVPHGRSLAIGRLTILLARSSGGIDFDSMDGKSVHLMFLTVAPPQDRSNLYLPVLGKIVELVKSSRIRKRLMAAATFEEISSTILEVDEDG